MFLMSEVLELGAREMPAAGIERAFNLSTDQRNKI